MTDDPEIKRSVRRTVGIANELDASKARWARRLSVFFILAALLVLAWIAIR
jgi:hypothetical protein